MNDSAVTGAGGRLRRLSGEHKSVRMVRETVTIHVPKAPSRSDATYRVSATFLFHNDGPAASVQMGFPESGGGDITRPKQSAMRNFRSAVDGAPASVRWQLLKAGDEDQMYDALWIKTVRFSAGQKRTVAVSYDAPFGSRAMPDLSRFVTYAFTGGNWKGVVDESVLKLTSALAGQTLIRVEKSDGKPPVSGRAGDALTFTWRNWQAEAGFLASVGTAPSNWMAPDNAAWPFDIPLYTLTRPGEPAIGSGAPRFDVLPLAIRHENTIFGRIAPWGDGELTEVGDLFGWPKLAAKTACRIAEDGESGVAKLRIGEKTVTFAPGRELASVDGKPWPLPAKPFALRRQQEGAGACLYVPIASALSALGQSPDLKTVSPRRYVLGKRA